MVKFTPKTDEELSNILAEGIADFEIVKSIDHISQNSGKESIKAIHKIWDKNGKEGLVTVYLMPAYAFLFKHACNACGLMDKYEKGEVQDHDFEGKKGKLVLGIKPGGKKPDSTENYPDQNFVADYVKREPGSTAPAASDKPLDDEIPFALVGIGLTLITSLTGII